MSELVVLKFGATWCGPCKTMEPNIKKMQEEFPDIKFVSVDTDDDQNLAKEHKIKSIPAIVLLKDGVEQNRVVGAVLITPLRKAFRDFVSSPKEEENDKE